VLIEARSADGKSFSKDVWPSSILGLLSLLEVGRRADMLGKEYGCAEKLYDMI